MRYKLFVIFALYISSVSFSQTSLFIKYKSNVSFEVVNQKVQSDKVLKDDETIRTLNVSIKVNHLAKGIIKNDEVLSRIIKVDFENESALQTYKSILSADPDVEYTQISNEYKVDFVPNDSLTGEQWALEKIKAFDAWDITAGSDTVLLAIIDTGIDYLHPDLINKIYINIGETGKDNHGRDKRSNGVDDDGNGFIDDWQGWDFTDRVGFPFDSTGGDYLNWDNDPIDENNHGTYIAGIAGAEVNNLTGIAGTAPNIKMLNLRAFDPGGYGEEDDVAAAILYAVKSGVKVINMSFGDYSFSYVLRDVIRYAYLLDVVLIASAGNSGSNEPHYPSGYSEVISVGNSTEQDYVAGGSNFGSTLDLVAPGSVILTTAKDNNYALISGTSASAPFVSGAASLIRSLGNFTNEEIKQMLKSSADDIGEAGWDLKSGAGRLNLLKALSAVAPSIIKFNYPKQDFSTLNDTLNINATVLSAYFSKYDLLYGTGLNPTSWNQLLSGIQNQTSGENIYTLPLQTLPDTAYTLRLLVYLTNGRTMEERINFSVNRTAPVAELISIGPAFYGEKATIMAAMYTDEPSVTRMYFRKLGTAAFQFVTLDGFATNNQFVKNYHYGFIPKQLVEQGNSYEVYFEAENLVGLKTLIKDNNQYFIFTPVYNAAISAETELPYSLPAGNIFDRPLNLTTSDYNEIAIRQLLSPRQTSIYKLQNEELVKIDSVEEQIFRDFGDFNFNGKKDFLSSFVRDGFMLEQSATGSSNLDVKFADTSGKFWPVLTADVDDDGIIEALVIDSDTSFALWEITSALSVKNKISLPNFSPKGPFKNRFDSPGAVIADLNKNGLNEIWMIDRDGDLFSYEYNGTSFIKGEVLSTEFLGSSANLTSGDYNGDGNTDIAILLHSIEELDIAPFHRLLILEHNNISFFPLFDNAFIDPSSEFTTFFADYDNSIKFVDVDTDGRDELVLFIYPYSYIFKYNSGSNTIISYKENINSNSVFAGDLNQNGVTEIAFPTINGIKFYEFSVSQKATTPTELTGYSSSTSQVVLRWSGAGDTFYILRGVTKGNLQIIDSTSNKNYTDNNVQNNSTYFYSVQAVDNSKFEKLSNLSTSVEVYVHKPAEVISAVNKTARTVLVTFDEKMLNTIENLQSFTILGFGSPNSISPANQYSYLLTYRTEIPLGINYLIVNNIKDFYGSPILADTKSFNVIDIPEEEEFYITSYEVLSPYSVKLVFNLPVDETAAINPANYSFNPANNVTSVSVDDKDNKIIYLNLTGNKPIGSVGIEYTLHINNLKSSAASGSLSINTGAGSYLVLTGFANNLADVYVYPNPAKVSSGKVTFANLPQRAKIIIWNINGKRIAEIEEADGNGGVDYNLKDDDGEQLNSGIYIFRIVKLDEFNNETEEKLGKFAVIR